MKLLGQIGIIFGVCLLGDFVVRLLPFPFPASVMALVLLLILLLTKALRLEQIEDLSGYLLRNMPFFFIPSGMGILENFGLIRDNAVALFVICIITTVLTFGATALTVGAVVRLQGRRAGR